MKQRIILASFLGCFALGLTVNVPEIPASLLSPAVFIPHVFETKSEEVVLAQREFSMEYRYPVESVSQVFKDNILLNIAYLDGRVKSASDIKWEEIDQPFTSKFTLKPGEAFAYHDQVYPEYEEKVVVTTNSRFNKQDGYKTDGYLYGDGVCQLASLISWVAKDANLEVKSPTNHDFAAIPEVPKAQGVSIYYDPFDKAHSVRSNLYITNNTDKDVSFIFEYKNGQLVVKAVKG
ncbi:MAG: hypothetical protein UW35_C0009G0014 [Candidatus Collierbacteria bacterium GW2011_GWF2_44_15]|uniref:VanW family protein n=2 Tax=Candidatus Collieribacteriota TaxID=1752725 RepID=A0A0G1JS55_9BACT|nr:MAG: hypothetical protein UW35_C0009G0014 [Candidatus Collierbacteria bacterium GW2011_GWF2_44_15]KKU29218.1 MAG: hypothetical protein UX41_C0021G0008 [Candidatus Collierbacteria bacterium GW2011_GWE1_46_18]